MRETPNSNPEPREPEQEPSLEIDEKSIKEVEAVLSVPKEEWVEKVTCGGMGVFNNFRDNLPGGQCFEKDVNDENPYTFAERGLYKNSHFLKKDLSPKDFANLIRDSLLETGVNIQELKEKNEQTRKIQRTINELYVNKKILSEEDEKEWEKLSRELSRIMAELHYDAAPALLKLLKKGYYRGEFTG